MKQIKYYLYSAKVSCSEKDKDRVLSYMLGKGIAFHGVKKGEDGVTFFVSGFDMKDTFLKNCCQLVGTDGVLPFLKSHGDRVGLGIGMLICMICLYISSLFIWDIKIEPIEGMSDDEVNEILNKAGLYQGVYIPSLDLERIRLNVLMSTDKLSYITVNINGSVATVQGQKRDEKKETDVKDDSPCNVVANEDGQIIRYQTKSGLVCRAVGDVVRKGELLISGMYEDEKLGVRTVRANGEVYAEVSRYIEVYYPCTVYEKTRTDNTSKGMSIEIFGKEIGISSCDEYGHYDEETEKKELVLFGVKLPLSVYLTERYEYGYVKRVLNEEETYRRALAEFEKKLVAETSHGELTEKDVQVYSDDGGCRIVCNLTLIKNIAQSSPITVYQSR